MTEAGDGEDGRIKSAIGIGSLLADGIGDTIRVSLTEDCVHEIPVAQALRRASVRDEQAATRSRSHGGRFSLRSVFLSNAARRETIELTVPQAAAAKNVRVVVTPGELGMRWRTRSTGWAITKPEIVYEEAGVVEVDPRDEAICAAESTATTAARHRRGWHRSAGHRRVSPARGDASTRAHPILLKDSLGSASAEGDFLQTLLVAATNIGSLLCDGIGDAVLVQGEEAPGQSLRLSYNILQAAGCRIFKTDYVACPSCGRTLFNLQTTTARIKARPSISRA